MLVSICWWLAILCLVCIALVVAHPLYLTWVLKKLRLPITCKVPRPFKVVDLKVDLPELRLELSELSLGIQDRKIRVVIGSLLILQRNKGIPAGKENLEFESIAGKTGDDLVKALARNLFKIVQMAKKVGAWKGKQEIVKVQPTIYTRKDVYNDIKKNFIKETIIKSIESTILMITFKLIDFEIGNIEIRLCANHSSNRKKPTPFEKFLNNSCFDHQVIIGCSVLMPHLNLEFSRMEGFILRFGAESIEVITSNPKPIITLTCPKLKFNIMPTPVFSSPKLAILSSNLLAECQLIEVHLNSKLLPTVEGLLTVLLCQSLESSGVSPPTLFERDLLEADKERLPLFFVPTLFAYFSVNVDAVKVSFQDIGASISMKALKFRVRGKAKFREELILEFLQEVKIKAEAIRGSRHSHSFLDIQGVILKTESLMFKKKGTTMIQMSNKLFTKVAMIYLKVDKIDFVVEPSITKIYEYLGKVLSINLDYSLSTYDEYLEEYRQIETDPNSEEAEPETIVMCLENILYSSII